MSNFTYVAFAFNRISLIGKDHYKFVEFMAKCKIKKYMIVTGLISACLSLIKLFNYRINYDHVQPDHPISVQENAWFDFTWQKTTFYILNLIFDLLNHLVFLLIHLVIDIYMLVRLRRTLREKAKKMIEENPSFEMNELDDRSLIDRNNKMKKRKKKEMDIKNSMNNAFKMVLFNSTVNILFKMLLWFGPLNNVIVNFDFKDSSSGYSFNIYYLLIRQSGFYFLIVDFGEFLSTLLISLQLFIFVRFDKKIGSAFKSFLNRS